ncbi:MAG: amino acid aminotransferase [Paracoccaceae bacterium]
MFDTIPQQPADKILALMTAFRADPRAAKVDLGVGVYKDASGRTPVMRAVKAAEARLQAEQETKSYVGLAGDPAFADAMIDLILDGAAPRDRIAAAATPGGTGAVHQLLQLVRMAAPGATVWVSDPTWPNHLTILKHLGIAHRTYRYLSDNAPVVDVDAVVADLAHAARGDVVLLHGCCHNPTGADPDDAGAARILDAVEAAGAVPMVDLAYQGFGDGLEADAAFTRAVVRRFPQAMIAASCSKNFGIYRERTGLALAIGADADGAGKAQGALEYLNRQTYSFPPDHGARVVTTILTDAELRADWMAELEEVRGGMLGLRRQLADELRRLTNSDRFDFLAAHRGMFSRLGASPEQVATMREDSGIYMVGDSRMNVAGLNAETVPVLARAIVAAGV